MKSPMKFHDIFLKSHGIPILATFRVPNYGKDKLGRIETSSVTPLIAGFFSPYD
jgi:hypothetical protein